MCTCGCSSSNPTGLSASPRSLLSPFWLCFCVTFLSYLFKDEFVRLLGKEAFNTLASDQLSVVSEALASILRAQNDLASQVDQVRSYTTSFFRSHPLATCLVSSPQWADQRALLLSESCLLHSFHFPGRMHSCCQSVCCKRGTWIVVHLNSHHSDLSALSWLDQLHPQHQKCNSKSPFGYCACFPDG